MQSTLSSPTSKTVVDSINIDYDGDSVRITTEATEKFTNEWAICYDVDGMYEILTLSIKAPEYANGTGEYYCTTYSEVIKQIIYEYRRDSKCYQHNPWWHRIKFKYEDITLSIEDIKISHPEYFI